MEFRDRVADALQKAEPIFYCRAIAQGDTLIQLWAHSYFLKRLARELEIDETKLQLRSYPRGKTPRGEIVDFGDYKDLNSSVKDLHKIGVLGYRLRAVADRLNMTVDTDDLTLVPQPSPADFNSWTHFSRERVLNEGQNLRESVLRNHSQIVVIGQFGSQSEKRFSDAQVADLARDVKEKDPESFVAVVSDKDYLETALPKPWDWIIRPDSYYAFPYRTGDFKKSIQNRSFEGIPDSLIFGKDINQFCSMFYASDLVVVTDSFGSWLSCGARSLREDRQGRVQPRDVIVLHTVANPDVWGIPGSTIVTSSAVDIQQILTGSQFDFLGYDEYYQGQFPPGVIKSNDSRRGILARDIDRLRATLTSFL